jgi:putative sporulation protein YtxC
MQTITVLFPNDNPTEISLFEQIVKVIQQHMDSTPVKIEWSRESGKTHTVYRFISWCEQEYDADTIDRVRSFVAMCLTEWVLQVREGFVMEKYFHQSWNDPASYEEIRPYVERALHQLDTGAPYSRRSVLYDAFFEYLQWESTLHVEGFIRFRLWKYLECVKEAVETGVDEYLRDREYQEFLELLRFLVSSQEPREELIHVIPSKKKPFFFYNGEKRLISLRALDKMLEEDQGFREEDYLVSALITLAPRKIVFHQANRFASIKEILHSIFADRVVFCETCVSCQSRHPLLDFKKSPLYNT